MKKQLLVGLLVQTYENTTGIRQDYTYFASMIPNMLHRKRKVKVVMVTADMSPEDIKLDLLILPGGADLSTALQTGRYCPKQGKDDPSYTYFADCSLKEWVEAGVPIFGICLGMQMLVNHFGGKLTHHMDGHALDGMHPMCTDEDSEVGLEKDWGMINSRHHQGYMMTSYTSLAPNDPFIYNCKPLAFSVRKDAVDSYFKNKATELDKSFLDNVVNDPSKLGYRRFPSGTVMEAFRHRTLKVAGVQWHPEELTNEDMVTRGDKTTQAIIRWLLDDKEFSAGVAVPVGMEGQEAGVANA